MSEPNRKLDKVVAPNLITFCLTLLFIYLFGFRIQHKLTELYLIEINVFRLGNYIWYDTKINSDYGYTQKPELNCCPTERQGQKKELFARRSSFVSGLATDG